MKLFYLFVYLLFAHILMSFTGMQIHEGTMSFLLCTPEPRRMLGTSRTFSRYIVNESTYENTKTNKQGE